MVVDQRTHQLARVRAFLNAALYPVQYAAGAPARLYADATDFFQGKDVLTRENARLKADDLLLKAKLEKYQALEAENRELRALLQSGRRIADRFMLAGIVALAPEPFTQKLMLDRGTDNGAYVGQPVIDAYGIVGQVTATEPSRAQVTMITDPSQSVPVQVLRNGLRALVFGIGRPDRVDVPFLTASADIQEGDMLVTSGLGGVFPAGYPVAQVTKVVNDPNEAFLKIGAKPLAHLEQGHDFLLIWPPNKRGPVMPPK